MSDRRRRNLHVVEDQEDDTDRLIDEIMDELNKEDHPEQEQEAKARQQKRKNRRRILVGAAVALVVLVAALLFVTLRTYTTIQVSDTYGISNAADSSYEEFAGGVLKYSSDGISYLNRRGEEQWNQSCQIKSPFVDVNDTSAAVADKGGNTILVFQRDGLQGEIQTTLPIEKISVSEQGVVGAILKDDMSAEVVCYDTAGNILVEHRASASGTGYPMALALSPDAEIMQVAYLYVQEGEIVSRLAYYNFGEAGEDVTDHQVSYQEYNDTILATAFYMSDNISVVVGDNCLSVFRGAEVPEEVATVTLDKEVQSVCHNSRYIGLILKNEGAGGCELRLYDTSGKLILSKDFMGEYRNVKLSGGQVILYDGRNCEIITRFGIQRFEGEFDNNIMEIFPIFGINRYIVMDANGMEVIRLAW